MEDFELMEQVNTLAIAFGYVGKVEVQPCTGMFEEGFVVMTSHGKVRVQADFCCCGGLVIDNGEEVD